MDARFTEAAARELAQLEAEAGGMTNAGFDFGDRLGEAVRLDLFNRDADTVAQVVTARFGNVLSEQEVQELVAQFQVQVQEKVAEKLADQSSV
ncbi:hypothetical protein [Leptolyngbya sp. NIES-2104]|uniref:hypothetical protein n=1 Tax=Leptolyngbya sp. NIES-2104 TaxID=1552121 RepID=UPI0006ECB73B|nr:hypothetical protein [Leptolyngbya sp. NIES-2104]GAP99693.1 hypothetical protein NIES2104_62590 [Leptolyngbya sp. NIES-2104]